MIPKRALIRYSIASAIALSAVTVSAAGMPCSIRPKSGTPSHDVPGLAKVTRPQAEHSALASLGAPAGAVVREGELEVERGCLVYSFDIDLPGKSGIEEVMVDAGNGKTLSHSHETPRQEASERAHEATRNPR